MNLNDFKLVIASGIFAAGCVTQGNLGEPSDGTTVDSEGITASTFSNVPGESPWLFGMHEPGGESRMSGANHPGWIVFTEEIGHNPGDIGGKSYSWASDQHYGVIVRLNNGYNDDSKNYHPGALPCESEYGNFAQRAANFVAHSSGAHIWLIGNETNFSREWPACGQTECTAFANLQPITAARYASAFKQVRAAIRGVSGHDHDQVIVQGTGPVNSEVACAPGTPAGYDWVNYHTDILERLKVNEYEIGADGFAIHAYTHDSNSANVQCDDPDWTHGCVTNPANGTQRHYQFLTYRDILAATPTVAKQLPVYITESDQELAPSWNDTPNDWIQKAYAEINSWNSDPSHQRIRALAIYRWAPYIDDNNKGDAKYDISRRPNVLNDFAAALTQPYRWDTADCDFDTATQMNMCDGPNGRFRASFKYFGLDAVGRPLEPEHCIGDECYQTFERLHMNRSASSPCKYGACLSFSGIDSFKRDNLGSPFSDAFDGDIAHCNDAPAIRRPTACIPLFTNQPGSQLNTIYQNNKGLELYGYPITAIRQSCNWEGKTTRPCLYTERAKLGYFANNAGTKYEWQGMRLGAEELGK